MGNRNSKGQFVKGHKVNFGNGPWRNKKRPDIGKLHTGSGNPMWRGDNIGVGGIHTWLARNFNKEKVCEFCGKTDKPKYDWALRTDFKYERKRENFIVLCRSCHMKYDYDSGVKLVYHPTEKVKEKIRQSINKFYETSKCKTEGQSS